MLSGQSTCYLALSLSISALCSPSKHPQPSSDCLGTRPLLPSVVCLYYPGGDNGNWPERAWARAVSPCPVLHAVPCAAATDGWGGSEGWPREGGSGACSQTPSPAQAAPLQLPKIPEWEGGRWPGLPRLGPVLPKLSLDKGPAPASFESVALRTLLLSFKGSRLWAQNAFSHLPHLIAKWDTVMTR